MKFSTRSDLHRFFARAGSSFVTSIHSYSFFTITGSSFVQPSNCTVSPPWLALNLYSPFIVFTRTNHSFAVFTFTNHSFVPPGAQELHKFHGNQCGRSQRQDYSPIGE